MDFMEEATARAIIAGQKDVIATQAAQIEALSDILQNAMAYIYSNNGFDENGLKPDGQRLDGVATCYGVKFDLKEARAAIAAVGEKP